jgi:hypothetical protein
VPLSSNTYTILEKDLLYIYRRYMYTFIIVNGGKMKSNLERIKTEYLKLTGNDPVIERSVFDIRFGTFLC